MSDKTNLNPIMDAIINAFKEKYSTDYSIGDYEDIDSEISLPGIFIQMSVIEGVENRIPEFFRADCTFRAYACESFKGQAKRRIRDTALDIAQFVDGNYWGDIDTFTKAAFVIAEEEPFNEKIEAAEIWYVEWHQQIYISNTK